MRVIHALGITVYAAEANRHVFTVGQIQTDDGARRKLITRMITTDFLQFILEEHQYV